MKDIPSATNGTPDLLAGWTARGQQALAVVLLLVLAGIGVRTGLGMLHRSGPTEIEKNAFLVAPLDLNEADLARLRLLPDVGDTLAANIVQYRQEHGGFRSVEELAEVAGIGEMRLARLRPWVRVEEVYDNETAIPVVETSREKPAKAPGASMRQGTGPSEPLDLNTASAEELAARIPGVGKVLSERIVAARRQRPFSAVEDLLLIYGIKDKTLEKIRPHVFVGPKRDGGPAVPAL